MPRLHHASTILAAAGCAAICACASTSSPPETPAFQHRFEHAEQWSKEFDDPSRDAWQQPDHVVAAMQLAPGMTIADLGAGTGYFEPHLSRAVGASGKVLALDVEPEMVAHLRERATHDHLDNVEARQVAADDPGLPPASVDRVLIVDTWHHIGARAAYASRLVTALKPGGQIVVVDFKMDAHRGPPPEHRIPPDEVVRQLGAAGLTAHIVEAGLPEQYVVAGALR